MVVTFGHRPLRMLSSRTITFLSTLLSTLTLIGVIVFVSHLFAYVQRTNTALLSQVHKCQIDSNDIWKEMTHLGIHDRSPRQSDRSSAQSALRVPSCCSCQQGRPGQRGKEGKQGLDGKDGPPGARGRNGRPGQYVQPTFTDGESCQKCRRAKAGLPGLPGVKGPRGPAGTSGQPGANGAVGQPGPPGAIGLRGDTGDFGRQGPQGDYGRILNGAPPGPPGPPGSMGPRGRVGFPGNDGAPGLEGSAGKRGEQGEKGANGAPGPPGAPGLQGPVGPKGTCNHCSMDRKTDDANQKMLPKTSPPSTAPPSQGIKTSTATVIPLFNVPRIYSNSPTQGDGSQPQGYLLLTSAQESKPEYWRVQQQRNHRHIQSTRQYQTQSHSRLNEHTKPAHLLAPVAHLRSKQSYSARAATQSYEHIEKNHPSQQQQQRETSEKIGTNDPPAEDHPSHSPSTTTVKENIVLDPYNTRRIVYWHRTNPYSLTGNEGLLPLSRSAIQYG